MSTFVCLLLLWKCINLVRHAFTCVLVSVTQRLKAHYQLGVHCPRNIFSSITRFFLIDTKPLAQANQVKGKNSCHAVTSINGIMPKKSRNEGGTLTKLYFLRWAYGGFEIPIGKVVTQNIREIGEEALSTTTQWCLCTVQVRCDIISFGTVLYASTRVKFTYKLVYSCRAAVSAVRNYVSEFLRQSGVQPSPT